MVIRLLYVASVRRFAVIKFVRTDRGSLETLPLAAGKKVWAGITNANQRPTSKKDRKVECPLFLPPGVVVPEKLLQKMSQAQTREEGRNLGIEIAWEMIDKISEYVAGFAVSAPFGNVKIALTVLKKMEMKDL